MLKKLIAPAVAAAAIALVPATASAVPAGLAGAQPETQTLQVRHRHHHLRLFLGIYGGGFDDGMSCREIYWRARNTGSPYWWRVYRYNCL